MDKRIRFTESSVRRLVAEEIRRLMEQVDYEGVKNVVTGASKLLKAIEAFRESANAVMTNATFAELNTLSETLEAMVSTPASYVDKPKPEVKTVKLRAVKDD